MWANTLYTAVAELSYKVRDFMKGVGSTASISLGRPTASLGSITFPWLDQFVEDFDIDTGGILSAEIDYDLLHIPDSEDAVNFTNADLMIEIVADGNEGNLSSRDRAAAMEMTSEVFASEMLPDELPPPPPDKGLGTLTIREAAGFFTEELGGSQGIGMEVTRVAPVEPTKAEPTNVVAMDVDSVSQSSDDDHEAASLVDLDEDYVNRTPPDPSHHPGMQILSEDNNQANAAPQPRAEKPLAEPRSTKMRLDKKPLLPANMIQPPNCLGWTKPLGRFRSSAWADMISLARTGVLPNLGSLRMRPLTVMFNSAEPAVALQIRIDSTNGRPEVPRPPTPDDVEIRRRE
ncbi:MAG: hypothetical protein SGPRY_006319 [Prymnesium sp.]